MNIGSGITFGSGLQIGNFYSGIPTNGLILNLDAGNSASYPGSGTTWTDLSATSHNFSFSAGAPSFTSAGNQSYFTFGNVAIGSSFLPATAYTKIAIFQTPGNYGNIISANASQTHAFWGASTQTLQSGHNGAWSTIQAAVTTPLNRWVFGAVSFNTTTGWRLYLGTNTPVTNSNTTPPSSDPSDVEIGGFAGNANNMNGSVGVALIYNRVLSDSEITQIRTYYQSRFTNLY